MTRALSRRRFVHRLGHGLVLGGVASSVSLLGARAARAAEVSAEVSLSSTTTRVGEPVRITMSLRVQGAAAPSQLPWPTAIQSSFAISNVSNMGGSSVDLFAGAGGAVYTRKVSAMITPIAAGSYELGFVVDVAGERVESNVPVLEVLAADEALPTPPAGRVPTEAPGPVFLWATIDKESVYIGEQVTYQLDVYERRSFLGVHLRKPPSFTDFFTEELDEGEPSIATVGGLDYRVRPGLRRALFPQRAGSLEIGAAELSVGGRQRLLSPALTVEVKPLPSEGRPASFSPNNVGRYTLETKVDRDRVEINEPVTLTVTIEGEGNVKFLDPGPWPALDGIRRYDPKVDTRPRKSSKLGGTRRYEFLLIPERGGTLTIPAHELSFFDPAAERYEVVRTEPITIEVEGPQTATPEPPPVSTSADDEIAPLLTEASLPRHTPRDRWLTPARWVYGMLAAPAAALVGFGGAALWRRYGADEVAQARARRKQRHRGLIDAAEHAVDSGEGFHGALAKLLHEIAVDRAGPDGVGLPRPELLRLLGQKGVPTHDVERLRDLLDRCDAARFGAQGDGRDDRQALLEEVLDLTRTSSLAKEAS